MKKNDKQRFARDKPLQGVRVLDLSKLLPGPFCSHYLAELGAEVVVVVPPFDHEVIHFPELQKGKKKIVLDLKKKSDQDQLKKLIKKVDVLLEGFRPGVMKRLKIDFLTLQKINPHLIFCSLTGYGQKAKDRAGHDLNYLAMTGFLRLLFGKQKSMIPGIPLADLIGGMNAALSIVSQLYIPLKKRKAIHLDIAITDSVQKWMLPMSLEVQEICRPLFEGQVARYQIYETKDHRFLAVAPLEEKFWKKLLKMLEVPEKVIIKGEKSLIQFFKQKISQKNAKELNFLVEDPELCISWVKS
ncbi:MAG: CoA transferase [Deltaproteobacteria bacterium]|nr:CoA transferase [Deltaproteobacteria bacterium]